MTGNLKISILVPVYGAENYISICAKSLFEQTYGDIEFVFVDDCTPDNSIDVLESVLNQYPKRKEQVRIIRHTKNRGAAAARNTLLENATGDYLLWVDADDFIENNAAEILVDKVLATNADLVCYGTAKISYNQKMKPYPLFQGLNSKDMIVDMLSGHILTTLWGNLIKRDLFIGNDVKFIEGLDVGEDMLALVKVAYYSKNIVTENTILYYYVVSNPNSLVRSFSLQKTFMTIKNLELLEIFLRGKMDVSAFVEKRKCDAYYDVVYGACLAGDFQSYKIAKSALAQIKSLPFKNKKGFLCSFFIKCDSYVVNRIWAIVILFLKKCATLPTKILGKPLHTFIL